MVEKSIVVLIRKGESCEEIKIKLILIVERHNVGFYARP
jgi:hypothetical protein